MEKPRRPSKVRIQDTPSRSGTAQTLLSEYFDGGHFHEVKKRNAHKFRKFGTNKLSHSESAPTITADAFPIDNDRLLAPVAPHAAHGAPLRSALKTPKTPGLGIGGSVHLGPLHVEDTHRVSDMIHRVALIPGGQPGSIRRAKTPKDPLTKASKMGELQLKNMLSSDSIKSVLEEVLDIHGEINQMAAAMSNHRFAAARRLEEANKQNLKLFQRMMSEVLMLHRVKFQSQTKSVSELEKTNTELETQLTALSESAATYRSRAERSEARVEELESLFRARQLEVDMMALEVQRHQEARKDMIDAMDADRKAKSKLARTQRQQEAEMLKAERKILYDQRHEMQLQLLRENAIHQDALMAQEAQRLKMRNDLQAMKDKQKNGVDEETQTDIDDFGVFDKQDGWVLPISGTVAVRNRWRRAMKFAGCPNCKGIGKFILQAAVHMNKLQRGELDNDPNVKKFKASGKWHVPDNMVQFMSNIPRSLQTSKLWPVSKTVRFIWNVAELKYTADSEDTAFGYSLQDLSEFTIETFLLRSPSRQEAEKTMFMLMSSLKDHVMSKRHSMLHTFARFLGAMDTKSSEEAPSRANVKAVVNASGLIKASNCSLPRSLLTVYLFARQCLLFPYKGQYVEGIATAKTNCESLRNNQAALENTEGDETSGWDIKVPDHVLVMEKFKLWIPLDRAVEVTKAILSFLSDKQMSIVFRHIERSAMFLSSTGSLSDADGMHTVVRAWMRKFQQATVAAGSENADGSDLIPQGSDKYTIVVDMEKILEAIVEMLLSRIRVVEEKLRKQFVEGDDNGDGVLSFQEFVAIVSQIAPHFPKRRILKMFREALMRGSDDDRIDKKSFVHVCKQHGLAQLVDINALKKTALADLTPQVIMPIKKENKSLKRYASILLKKQDSKGIVIKPKFSLSEVVTAAMTINRALRRQASSLKDDSKDDAPVLRKVASEEITPSSDEASKIYVENRTANIRRTNSEDGMKKKKAAQMSDDDEDEEEGTPLFPRYSQLQKKSARVPSMVLRRIDSQEEYHPDAGDEETFIQIHRNASKDSTSSTARRSSLGGTAVAACGGSGRSSKVSIISTARSTDSDADEYGQIVTLGSMRRMVSIPSDDSAGPTTKRAAVSCGSKPSYDDDDDDDDDEGDSSSILFGSDGDDEPDLSDI